MSKVCTIALIAGAALVGMASFSAANAYDRRVEIDNNSTSTITQIFASNVGTDDWEEDVLGARMLPPGYRVRINLDDGSGYCHFDFKTVFRDGTKVVRRNVDICAITKYTLTN